MRKAIAIIATGIIALTGFASTANAAKRPKPPVAEVHNLLDRYPFPYGAKDTLPWTVYRVIRGIK